MTERKIFHRFNKGDKVTMSATALKQYYTRDTLYGRIRFEVLDLVDDGEDSFCKIAPYHYVGGGIDRDPSFVPEEALWLADAKYYCGEIVEIALMENDPDWKHKGTLWSIRDIMHDEQDRIWYKVTQVGNHRESRVVTQDELRRI